jgi:hypothetical protein
MAIRLADLSSAAARSYRTAFSRTLSEARGKREATAFLSHSHQDKEYAKGLQVLLREHGWEVYVDWEDSGMPDTPNRETAATVQRRINEFDWFLFLSTPNAALSKWCPWELGYADKSKGYDRILIIATVDASGRESGREYIQLYRRVEMATGNILAAFPAGMTKGGTLIRDL